jgi:hypothetical protein
VEEYVMRRFALFFSLSSIVACGGSSSDAGGGPNAGPPGSETPVTPDDPGTSTPPTTTANVSIVMRGSIAPFTHTDGHAGETPRRQIAAVKSLWLYRSAEDENPLKVFDLGNAPVEVDFVTETPVTVATVPVASLAPGEFKVAKAGVAYVKYAVDATMHTPLPIAGYYDNVQALSDGAVIDGGARKRGWHRYSFVAGGTVLGTIQGDDAPTPVATTKGGITMDMSGPETFYVFPVDVALDNTVTEDYASSFVANVHQSFRGQDQPHLGYQAGVFDTTVTAFEPVIAFGANSFTLDVGPKAAAP